MPMSAWYALWTRSRHERLVCNELTTRKFEAFLPTITRWSAWKDRRKRIDWPLFPGYCFARFDVDARFSVLNCSGVATIVSFNGEPAAIPDQEIENIRRLVNSELRYDPCPLIREGTLVEVVRGPLHGVVGRLVRKGSHAHLVLSVEMVNRAVSVQVDASDVVNV
jgi:transcription termination/antitermination protein NusG